MRGLVVALLLWVSAAGAAVAQDPPGLSRLHDQLRLTSQQEQAWRDWVADSRPSPQAEDRRRAAETLMPTLPTPRRIALMQAAMTADLADLRRIGAATTAFYNQLSPAQQQAFDRETLPQDDPDTARR